jgi:glycosyltransferase involved in cell wall biosynthesis
MKIALDAKRALNNVAGLGQYSRILLNAFFRDFPEHEYHLFSSKTKELLQKEIKGNYKLHLPESYFSKRVSAYWRSYGITYDLIKDSYDVYHGLSNELPLNISKASSIKKIVTIHDVIFLKHPEQYSTIDRQIYDYKTRYAAENADIIIAISKETKSDLIKYYKIPEKKILVIYQSCDPSFYSEATPGKKTEVKKKYNLPEKYILNVSSFFSRKNHKAIIEAIHLLKDKTDAHVVFIGGQGNIKEEIIFLVKNKKMENRFHFLSDVGNEDMPAIYQQASAFIYPSFFEGFGIPILEALFSKIPVITTKGGCFEEAGGSQSLYVNPSDSHELSEVLYKVLSDSELSNRMIQQGLVHANEMKDDVFAKKIMNIYN